MEAVFCQQATRAVLPRRRQPDIPAITGGGNMSRKRRTRSYVYGRAQVLLATVFVFFSLPTLGIAQLGGRPEKSNLAISYIQASGAFTPLWVAQEAGLLKKNGLDVTL